MFPGHSLKNDLFPGQNTDMPRISKKSDQLLHSVAEMKHLDFKNTNGNTQ